jgi:glucose/arabinose dehydrogenase
VVHITDVYGEDATVDLVGSLCLQAVKRADSQQQQQQQEQQQQQQSSQKEKHPPPESSSASATSMIPLINKLSFTLQMYERRTGLRVSIDKPEVGVYSNDSGEFTPLTAEQLEQVAYNQPAITFKRGLLSSAAKPSYTMNAPNSKSYFSLSDLLDTIAAFEQYDRPSTEWFGGIDCHHIFFEGVHATPEGWLISWGS